MERLTEAQPSRLTVTKQPSAARDIYYHFLKRPLVNTCHIHVCLQKGCAGLVAVSRFGAMACSGAAGADRQPDLCLEFPGWRRTATATGTSPSADTDAASHAGSGVRLCYGSLVSTAELPCAIMCCRASPKDLVPKAPPHTRAQLPSMCVKLQPGSWNVVGAVLTPERPPTGGLERSWIKCIHSHPFQPSPPNLSPDGHCVSLFVGSARSPVPSKDGSLSEA